MPNGVADRSQDFYQGSEGVRSPQFAANRPIVTGGYRRTSTLDSLMPSGNGMGSQDKQRALMGVMRSPMGQSDQTFDKGLWLRNEQPVSIYNKTYG